MVLIIKEAIPASFFMSIVCVFNRSTQIIDKKNADRSQHFLKFNSKVRITHQQRQLLVGLFGLVLL